MKNILLVITALTLLISCSSNGSDYENSSPYSFVAEPECGSAISSFWTTIFARQVIGAQGYKFIVDDGTQVREFITPDSRFNLRDLGEVHANGSYTIRVDVLLDGSYVEGIESCTIYTTADATKQTNPALDVRN